MEPHGQLARFCYEIRNFRGVVMIALRKKNGADRHAKPDVRARLSALYKDFDALQQDIRGLMSDVGSAAGDQVKGTVADGLQSAQSAVDQAETWGAKNVKSIRKSVKNQPFRACAIALGAGALMGSFLLRR